MGSSRFRRGGIPTPARVSPIPLSQLLPRKRQLRNFHTNVTHCLLYAPNASPNTFHVRRGSPALVLVLFESTIMAKHVVFDVVGTCVSFDAYYESIERAIGEQLRQHNMTAKHFGFTWQTAAELEFTFLSLAGDYVPYKDVMRGLFYRSLWMAGVREPRAFASDADREACLEGYASLALRADCCACFQTLRENGFTVWCFTSGDTQRVKGYFDRAGVELSLENVVSCDTLGVAKPALAAYESVWARLGKDDVKWFAAAHMWDVAAATKVGFRGAWTAALEKEPCLDVFQHAKMEVISESLLGMAEEIIRKSRT